MRIEFDPAKNERNMADHKLSFEEFVGFDGEPFIEEDRRRDYGEKRLRAFGRIEGVPHCLVFTHRGDVMRLISFRRAHAKELRRYEQ